MKLSALAAIASGQVVGNPDLTIKGVASVETAQEGDLAFVLEEKHLAEAIASKASALVVPSKLKVEGKTTLVVANPRLAMTQILPLFAKKRKKPTGIHKMAIVPKSCQLSNGVALGPFVVLGENVILGQNTIVLPHTYIGDNTTIGSNCYIHDNVSIYANSNIGNHVVLHSGVRLGVDGYGYIQEDKKHLKIPQIGTVVIEDDVELYANVCISRGTFGATVIGAGTKIDNLTHVAHNCKIGKNCAVVSLVGFAGSVTLGDNVLVAGQAGFNGHITIGDNAIVMAKSGVTKDIPANSLISGFPAQDHKKEIAYQASLRHLAKKNK